MSNIFYNESIFDSYQDYVLGGFLVEEGDVVDFTTISNAVNKRIEVLIEDFYMRGWSANASTDNQYTQEDAMIDIAFMIKDNLGVMPEGLSMSYLKTTILNSEKMMKWLNQEVKSRVEDYMKYEMPTNSSTPFMGVPSLGDKAQIEDKEKYEEAESGTLQTTLEQYIEELSLIEL